MKGRLLIITLLFMGTISTSLVSEPDVLNFQEAVQKGLIRCSFKNNPESPHYMRPILFEATNLKDQPITIKVDAGQQFFPQDDKYQNLIVTLGGNFKLKPNEKKSIALFAMCTEATDAAPSESISYKPAKQNNIKLRKMAEFIAQNKSHDVTGQNAMWCVSNNYAIAGIIGPEPSEVNKLQKFVSQLLGKPLPPPSSIQNYAHDYHAVPRVEISFKGSMTFSYSEPKSVTIALFNKNNIVVRELYNDTAVTPGVHKVEYAFDNSLYNEDIYYVRLICDGNIQINRKLKMNQ